MDRRRKSGQYIIEAAARSIDGDRVVAAHGTAHGRDPKTGSFFHAIFLALCTHTHHLPTRRLLMKSGRKILCGYAKNLCYDWWVVRERVFFVIFSVCATHAVLVGPTRGTDGAVAKGTRLQKRPGAWPSSLRLGHGVELIMDESC
jgi:hypothetical protein